MCMEGLLRYDEHNRLASRRGRALGDSAEHGATFWLQPDDARVE